MEQLEMAKAHAVEEKMPKGRKPRSSRRREGRGQARRGCNLEVRPERRERDGRGASSSLHGARLERHQAAQPLAASTGAEKGPAAQRSKLSPGILEPSTTPTIIMRIMAAGVISHMPGGALSMRCLI